MIEKMRDCKKCGRGFVTTNAKQDLCPGCRDTDVMRAELVEGCRIYYTGDMANDEGFGVVTKRYQDRWGDWVNVVMDDGRIKNSLGVCLFSPEYLGHGGTRFVTEKAYKAWEVKRYEEAKKAGSPFAECIKPRG